MGDRGDAVAPGGGAVALSGNAALPGMEKDGDAVESPAVDLEAMVGSTENAGDGGLQWLKSACVYAALAALVPSKIRAKMGSSRMARTSWDSSTLTAVRVAVVGEDLGDVVAVLLPNAGKVPGRRRDVNVVHGGEAAEEERRRVGARGEAAEEWHGWSRTEDGELDVPAAESGLREDTTDDGVIEDGEDKLGELDLDGGGSLGGGGLVVEVEGVRVAALVGLGVLDGGHEGVGDGGFIGVEAKEEEAETEESLSRETTKQRSRALSWMRGE
uniref:Uncharacterized protein n=1 Tax=Oryza barthii TaxID=65489 RepID=A0A0D3EPT9_9ORYZ